MCTFPSSRNSFKPFKNCPMQCISSTKPSTTKPVTWYCNWKPQNGEWKEPGSNCGSRMPSSNLHVQATSEGGFTGLDFQGCLNTPIDTISHPCAMRALSRPKEAKSKMNEEQRKKGHMGLFQSTPGRHNERAMLVDSVARRPIGRGSARDRMMDVMVPSVNYGATIETSTNK